MGRCFPDGADGGGFVYYRQIVSYGQMEPGVDVLRCVRHTDLQHGLARHMGRYVGHSVTEHRNLCLIETHGGQGQTASDGDRDPFGMELFRTTDELSRNC